MFLYEARAARARARARARLVQEHQLHNWEPILASLGPGGPKNLRKPIKVNVNLRLDRPHRPSALAAALPAPAARPKIRQRRRGPGRSPSILEL